MVSFCDKLKIMKTVRAPHLWPLFLNESLRRIAVSWLSIFSSIFIYRTLMISFDSRLALTMVFLFWALFGLAHLLGNCLAEDLSLKWGLKAQMGLGISLMIPSFLFFFLSSRYLFFLFPAGMVWGLAAGIYWFGWHGEAGKLDDEGKFGQIFGASALWGSVVRFVAPITGGFLITLGGYNWLFGFAIALIILALLALRPLSAKKTHHDTSLKEVIHLFASHKKAFLAYFSLGGLGVITGSSFVLYLSLILKKELAIGEFFSVSLLFVGIVKWKFGQLIDSGKQSRLILLGSLGRACVWLGRLVTGSIPLLFGLNVVNDLGVGMVGMPLGALALKKGIDGHSMGRAVLFREVAGSLGYIVIGLVLAGLAWLGQPLTSGFVLAIPLSLAPILIYGKKK